VRRDDGVTAVTVPTASTDRKVESLEISKIVADRGLQARASMNQGTIDEYAAAIAEGVELPPVVVFRDDGGKLHLADGHHRVAAHRKLGSGNVAAQVQPGTREDARLYAIGANATHGLPRTNEDKRRAARMLILDDKYASEPDREIARRTATSHTFIAKLRDDQDVEAARVALALKEIRDKRLYRNTHNSFADYCRQQFDLDPDLVAVAIAFAEAA